jgi:ribosomal protein L12E/L44/L45/RPP1/RPP2
VNFWQENKAFVIVIGVAVVALFFLWPSLLDLGPTVVSLNRTSYDGTELERRKLKSSLDKYYPSQGKPIPVSLALGDVRKANQLLLTNFEEMHRWMSFVPRWPFRIPDMYTGNERPAYVSRCYTYAQTGELFSKGKEYEVHEPYDGLNFLASARNIKLGDPYFGLRDMAIPEAIKNPDCCIMQIALLHDLGHLAIRLGIDEILSMSPGEPYTWAVKGTDVAKAYPINLCVSSDLPTLLSLLHALDGTHGRVVEATAAAEEPPPAPAPAAPRPRPAAGEEAKAEAKAEVKEEAKEERPAPDTKEPAGPKIIIQIQGKPSYYVPSADQAGLKERLTLFRPSEADPHNLKFVANAIVTRSLGDDRLEAVIEPFSDVTFGPDGKTTRNMVRKGDLASSRFFLLRSIKYVKVVDAKVEKDKDGFPTDVVPAHLETDLSVAALEFLKAEAPKVTVETKPAAEPRSGPRGPRL